MFGKPPATVWENMESLKKYPDKVAVLKQGDVLTQDIIDAFVAGALLRWRTELKNRIIPENLEIVKACQCLHSAESANDMDLYYWEKINTLRVQLAKDSLAQKSIFTRIKDAFAAGNDELASALQVEMSDVIAELKATYASYKMNMIHLSCK